jgi:competence protein ComEA
VDPPTSAWRVFDSPTGPDGEAGAGRPRATVATNPAPSLDPRLAIAGVLGAMAIGGLAVVLLLSGATERSIEGPDAAVGTSPTDAPLGIDGDLVVDVAGAVARPGIYHLGTGARVGDAIEAAGGFGPRVDVARVGLELNLAETITDGQQIHVPSRDDPVPVGGGSGSSGGAAGGGNGGPTSLVNLNTASESELDTLPGIGPVTAAKIIAARATAPFKTVEELRERGLVGEKTFESLKALITVG